MTKMDGKSIFKSPWKLKIVQVRSVFLNGKRVEDLQHQLIVLVLGVQMMAGDPVQVLVEHNPHNQEHILISQRLKMGVKRVLLQMGRLKLAIVEQSNHVVKLENGKTGRVQVMVL
jgi:hypothetical protein